MAYKNPKKQRAYMKRWRQKHPNYMRQYYRFAVKPFARPSAPVRIPVSEEIEV